MEKIYIQSALFSTAILVVYAVMSPPLALSAESAPTLDESTRVRKGIVVNVDAATQKLVVDFDGVSVFVLTNASTTVNSSNGEETRLSFLRDGSAVYVFGRYNNDTRSIEAEKIVMRNKPVTGRKSLSRAEMKNVRETKNKNTSSILENLNLTAK